MPERQMKCPSCGAMLVIPPGCCNCIVKCGRCQHRFRLSGPDSATEDAVASWLVGDDEESDRQAPRGERRPQEAVPGREESHHVAGHESSGGTAVLTAVNEPIRVVKVDRHQGVIFEFPASRLTSTAFRIAMPRRCLRCGGRAHLRAHVIIYAPELKDSISLEAEHSAGKLVLSDGDARDLNSDELLRRLPHVPNVPHPGDQPMPYWICDMCSGAGAISGQINVNTVTGVGWCRLKIRNLRRALEFLSAAGGEGMPDYDELRKHVAAVVESPWDMLPESVQHRLEQWFRPREGERFITYVPDRNLARTEDGMAGIVISDQRFVFHTHMRHKESLVSQALDLQLTTVGGRGDLCIKAPGWEIKHTTLDRDGIDLVRRGLISGKYQVVWH
jgi:hypothetical protein